MGVTYIWVHAHLVDDVLIKGTGVAQKFARDVICVLQTTQDGIFAREETTLAKLHSLGVRVIVDALDPEVVSLGGILGNVVFEDDDIGIRYVLRID